MEQSNSQSTCSITQTRNAIIWRVHTMRSTLRLLTVIDPLMFKTRGSYLWCRDQLHNLLVVNQTQSKCTSSSVKTRGHFDRTNFSWLKKSHVTLMSWNMQFLNFFLHAYDEVTVSDALM